MEVVVDDFTVVPTRITEESSTGHYLYVKQHEAVNSDESKPTDRTILVLNVPPYVNEACLRRSFSQCGKVIAVHIHKNATSGQPNIEKSQHFKMHPPVTGFKVAYIVYKNPGSVAKAKKWRFEKAIILSTKQHPLNTGIKKWCNEVKKEHQFDADKLQSEVTSYMEKYDKKQQEAIEQEKKDAEPDEDGWITVTRHGKNKGIPRTEVMEHKITEKEKKKNREKELLNFYAFQFRETKREHIAELRKKFEEDKNRIALMKAQRKFKPY